mgnify:FL=1
MGRLSTTITTTVNVLVSASLKTRVVAELESYRKHQKAMKAAEAKMETAHAKAISFLVDGGADSLVENGTEIEGFRVKRIRGKQKRLDKKILTRLGVNQEMFEEATVETDKKPYVRIWLPGETADYNEREK